LYAIQATSVGEALRVEVAEADKDRLSRNFKHLAEGGRIQMPLARQPGTPRWAG
jgi:hypothetical protein